VIGEDIAVFAAQQRMLDLKPDAPLLNIRYDNGPLQARRLIAQLVADERGERLAAEEDAHVPA